MHIDFTLFLTVIKYLVGITILIVVFFAPAYLAQMNGKDKLSVVIVRISSWLFGWTGVGWLFALYWAVKK